MWTKRNLLRAILAAAMLLAVANVARPATPEQIEDAIDAGVAWLVANQNGDGSWGTSELVAQTGLAVVKLQDRARELQTTEYDEEIQAGLDYIFSQAMINPYGLGSDVICFPFLGSHETYNTGIVMMAVANDGDLSQVVATGPANGWTYEQVMEGCVQFFVLTQNSDGGWSYSYTPGGSSDQSNSGYAVLGISYARSAGIDTSAVDAGLTSWVAAIQAGDGGSRYMIGWDWQNILKTGNLTFQMSYLGMGPGDAAFDAAIGYIELHWRDFIDPGWGYGGPWYDYQAMYCAMKGLQASGVDEIDTDGDPDLEDWFNQEPPASPPQDFASVIVATQNGDGSWTDNDWGFETLGTAWALLTLEKVTVIHEIEVEVDVKPGSYPSSVNLKSKGLTPVAIHTTEDFDAAEIDPSTVVLDPDVCVIMPVKAELDDCDEVWDPVLMEMVGDGDIDLVVFFVTADLDCLGDVTEVAIGGLTYGGIPIVGTSDISFVKQGPKPK